MQQAANEFFPFLLTDEQKKNQIIMGLWLQHRSKATARNKFKGGNFLNQFRPGHFFGVIMIKDVHALGCETA
jgi:hypothetical protein